MIYMKFNSSSNKKRELDRLSEYNHFAYTAVLQNITDLLSTYTNITDKIALLDYYIRIIKKNVISDYENWVIDPHYLSLADNVKEYFKLPRFGWFNFPTYYYNENEERVSVFTSHQEIQMQDTDILVYPTEDRKITKWLEIIKENEDISSSIAHNLNYLPYIQMCLVLSGGHHQISAYRAYGRNLKLKVKTMDITKLFNYVSTDGSKWLYKYSPEIDDDEICEYRLALIYTLAKIKFRYETGEEI